MRRPHTSSEEGFTFIELLAVVLILGVLVLAALPNYFGAESTSKSKVDQANVHAINAALALYKFNNGSCPADATAFDTFMGNTTYFPDGKPSDPYTSTSAPYKDSYDSATCRVPVNNGTINHSTGGGH